MPETPVSDLTQATAGRRAVARPVRRQRNLTNKWMRRLHMWTSMTSLLIVLFFSVTGITLNHPSWTFGQDPVVADAKGVLPVGSVSGTGEAAAVEWLAVSEYLRSQGITGEITDHSVQNGEGSISYRGPGYAADVTFSVTTRAYELRTTRSGLVAVFNDLHKGRHASPLWKWIIDITAALLVVMSLTGIVLQLTIRRTRRLGLVLSGVGFVLAVVLIVLSM